MKTTVPEGTLLWEPAPEQIEQTNLTRYRHWLTETRGLRFDDYHALWQWSVDETEAFWASLWDYFDIRSHAPYTAVLGKRDMPGADWFPGSTLNFAEHLFRMASAEHPALIFRTETLPMTELSWAELRAQVAALAAHLRDSGVKPGDRVAAFLPNSPHAFIGMLAAASLGAVWSSCSPDFGADSVTERFSQIAPVVLIAVNGYTYNGKKMDRSPQVSRLVSQLTSLREVITISWLPDGPAIPPQSGLRFTDWQQAVSRKEAELTFEPVPFAHPLWVLYSSGTTGLPKPIVHGHGGMLLEHLKYMEFHADVRPGDRFFWYSTTGWMMWNVVLAALLRGATAVLYDGSPAWPRADVLWKYAAQARMTTFGTSATYLVNCLKTGMRPAQSHDLSSLRSVGSTGSPLPPEGFNWVYQEVGRHIQLNSTSGGTDICSSFVGGNPTLPVHAGEIQCRVLGAAVEAWNEAGQAVTEEVGEMVITRPMPCMPVMFWGDEGMKRYRESYFEMFPGVWRHGDWLKVTSRGSCVIYGRSDATLNKMGVRIGTAEIYRAVEAEAAVRDSLIVSLERADGSWYMPLFVVMQQGATLDDDLRRRIGANIRDRIAPRFVPDAIIQIPEIPYTLSGKKMEKPVKRILEGTPVAKAASPDSMRNPDSLSLFEKLRLG
ncbi:acetoacetyl-CoA synthetase [Cyclonatronum proteinivorum]|uniref:Acetoacetyl-CoA synthetase n=1 Tax=Cyclonatronum proteinivorum TaxID=1457365 RepID=A0A345UHH8_9BACT|nr:acetoacetate--CoA ligase [Cyclonatronum proteinivorum]AXI99929.1 acetoacetyl-CoA synthetase [Cyclonatronum proteinivorum]